MELPFLVAEVADNVRAIDLVAVVEIVDADNASDQCYKTFSQRTTATAK